MRTPALAVGLTVVIAQLAVGAQSRISRHSDGRPDLSGYWTNDSFTPLERAPELGDKEFFAPEEAASYFKQRLDRLNGQAKDDIHYDDALWQAETYTKQPNLRTSIVFEPRDGRLPPLTPDAQRRDAERREAARRRGPADSAQSRTLGERCISWGNVGPPMRSSLERVELLQATVGATSRLAGGPFQVRPIVGWFRAAHPRTAMVVSATRRQLTPDNG
jgi:hypothetical protein